MNTGSTRVAFDLQARYKEAGDADIEAAERYRKLARECPSLRRQYLRRAVESEQSAALNLAKAAEGAQ